MRKCNCNNGNNEIQDAKVVAQFYAGGKMVINLDGPVMEMDVLIACIIDSYLKSAELGVSPTMSRWTEIIAEKRAYEASMEAVNEAIKEGEDE
jgi:hypothetical protein